MCIQLLESVKKEYQSFKENGFNRGQGGYGGRGGRGGSGNGRARGGHNDRYPSNDHNYHEMGSPIASGYAQTYAPYPNQQSPTTPALPVPAGQSAPAPPAASQEIENYGRQMEEWATAQYGYNPYAAYGGYVAYAYSQQPAASYPGGSVASATSVAGYPTTSYDPTAPTYPTATTGYPTGSYDPTAAYPSATAHSASYTDYSAYYGQMVTASAPGTAPPPPPPPPADEAVPPPPPGF